MVHTNQIVKLNSDLVNLCLVQRKNIILNNKTSNILCTNKDFFYHYMYYNIHFKVAQRDLKEKKNSEKVLVLSFMYCERTKNQSKVV